MSSPLRLPGFEDYPPDEPLRRRRRSPTPSIAPPSVVLEPIPGTPAAAAPGRPDDSPFTIDVVRSARRKRTVGAQLIGGVLRITVPNWMTSAETAPFVRDFDAKFRRKLRSERVELPARAAALAKRYGMRTPTEIRWVDDMASRWASCTSSTGVIRMSSRLTAYPSWVLDYVIIHELAHLTEANHSARFWKLVDAYPLVERATGYLIAKSGDNDSDF